MSEVKIKKAFVDLHNFLAENKQKKISTVFETLLNMMTAHPGGGGGGESIVIRDAEENVVAIFCFYHKRWEMVTDIAYGTKASSKSGLYNMCKEGNSLYTKQNAEAKKASAGILARLQDPESLVTIEDIPVIQAEIEKERTVIVATSKPEHSYATRAEVFQAMGVPDPNAIEVAEESHY